MKKVFLLTMCAFFTLCLSAQDYSQLYIIGSATPTGWDNGASEALTLVDGSDAVLSWSGQLKVGEFKFINARGSYNNSFTPAATTPVVLGEAYSILFNDGGDKKFTVSTPGLYTVTVDMRNMLVTVTETIVELPTELWAVGSAVPDGLAKLQAYPSGDKTKLRYIGTLSTGDISFISTETEGDNSQYFVPVTAGTELLGVTLANLANSSASGWSVSNASTLYKITVDLLNKSLIAEIFQPWDNLYIVGGATAIGWDAGNAIQLVKDNVDPNVYVYDGELNIAASGPDANKFKILGQLDWGPRSIHPYSTDEPLLGSQNILMNSGDDKWIINSEEQGHYILTVDLFNETVHAEYKGLTDATPKIKEKSFQIISKKGCVQITSFDRITNVVLTDLSGRTIATAKNATTISLGENLPHGIYIVKLWTKNIPSVQKVVIK